MSCLGGHELITLDWLEVMLIWEKKQQSKELVEQAGTKMRTLHRIKLILKRQNPSTEESQCKTSAKQSEWNVNCSGNVDRSILQNKQSLKVRRKNRTRTV